jgi:curved DNA-binding protein CbpA
MIQRDTKTPQDNPAEEIRPLVERLDSELDQLSYYKILGVGHSASTSAIQQAFYRRAVQLHPDRHHGLKDADLKTKIYRVYKRISEGYKVLSSERSRRLYDRGLRRGDLRMQRNEHQTNLKENPYATTQAMSPEIDGLIREVSELLKKREFTQAVSVLETSLTAHPDSSRLQRKLKDAKRLRKLWQT